MNEKENMITTFKTFIILLLFSTSLNANELMQRKTPVGEIKVIQLPKRVALEAHSKESYFNADNGLFRNLFSYINANDISMTTPVEAEINPGSMRFFVGKDDQRKAIKSTSEVVVRTIDPLVVLTIGIRGSYSEDRFHKNHKRLLSWINKNKEYEAVSEAYAVYWNGPFVPGIFKRSEVHLPIVKKKIDKQKPKLKIDNTR
ncbi:MAG: hypothetical protein CMI26_02580 [Opitutae bacterium]|nr:hypothetical protein [Opitutae bacterium]